MKKLVLLPVIALALTACDALDAPKNMVEMKQTTHEMSEKMSTMTEAVRLQKVSIAIEKMNEPRNRAALFPVPTRLLPWGKLFAESATTKEIVDFVYVNLKEIEEVLETTGMTKAADLTEEDYKQSEFVAIGEPSALSEDELKMIRQDKWATLYSLMIISSYIPDEKINEIIGSYIRGNDVRQKTGLAILAMRAYFIREILLKQSLKVDAGTAETLDNSGAMNEAISWLVKLDQVSKLKLKLPIEVKVQEKSQKLLYFRSLHDDSARKATAEMWVRALSEAEEGTQAYATNVIDAQQDTEEIAKQKQAMATMKSYIASWKAVLQ